MRYSEMLLMKAEALIMNGELTESKQLINRVRSRVHAFEYTTLGDRAKAFSLLRRELQVEFCGEQQRFRDLVRWGIAKEVINSEKAATKGFTWFSGQTRSITNSSNRKGREFRHEWRC